MPVDTATVLHLWDRAEPLDDGGRAVALAAVVAPAADPAEVATWPLGRRDERLLRLCAAIAGPVIDAVTSCPACCEDLAFELDTAALPSGPDAPAPVVELDGWRVACRPVSTVDLADAAATGDRAAAEALLLDRVVVDVTPPAGTAPGEALPSAVRAAVSGAVAEADPLAEVVVGLACPACGGAVEATVDVATFAWAAVDARARRALQDVDVLARVYGWTEPDVLALGDRRRASYVALARGRAS